MSQQEATERESNSDPIQSVVQKLADSITESINSQDFDAASTKTNLLFPLIEVQGRYSGRPPIPDEIKAMQKDMGDMHTEMDKIGDRLKIYTFVARMIPLILIVGAIVAYSFYGMVTHMAPQSLVQYLAPITGLAGAVIGYWFGRQGAGS